MVTNILEEPITSIIRNVGNHLQDYNVL